jgi:hypothetical protein
VKKLSLIFALLSFGGLVHAQNQALNIDDDAPTNSGSPAIGWAYPPCFGASCAGGSGVLVNTTTTLAVTTTGSEVAVTAASYAGMVLGNFVVVDTGTNQEVVTILELPGSSFSAIFTKTHALGVPVVSFRQTIDNSSPSLDGESMQFNNYGEAESNVLWFYDNGAQNNAYYFYSDQWFYLDANGATGNALEYDQWKYVHAGDGGVTQNTRFMFGGQCDLNHHLWDVWNSYTAAWIPTTLACSPAIETWHHLITVGYYTAGDTSCTGSYACMHFPYVVIDGTLTNLNLSESAGPLPSGWVEQTGTQDQLDVKTVEQTEWVDLFNFYTVATAAPFFTCNPSANPCPAPSASFTVGTPGTVTITGLGVPAPTFTVTGTLPSGVTLVNNGNGTATLSGTPAPGTGGVYSFTLTASNGVSPNAFQTFTLTVYSLPVFTSATSATFTEGQPNSFNVTATGYPVPGIFLYAGTLPAGLIFTSNDGAGTGILSGTPTAAGTTALVFEAFDNPYGIFQNFTLTVNAPVQIAPTPYTLNAVQPPTTSSNTNYAAWESVLSSGNNLFTGATAIVSDGCSSACGQSTYVDQGTSYPILSWTAEDALVATYTSQGKKANIIQAASIEGGQNNGTSSYVFTQNWADLLDTDGSGQYRGLVWTSGQMYRTLQYICVGTCPGTGTYWQMTGTVALPGNPGAANYGQGCVAGATEPAFTGAGPYTETATYPCTWTKVGAHAPPQDVSCSPSFTGTNCYSIAITNIVGSGGTVTVSLAAAPTFTYPDSITIAGITNSSYTALNNTWSLSAQPGASSLTFSDGPSYASCNASCLGGSPVVEQTHVLNLNTPNATTAVLASALPVAYEMPYAVWRNWFCDQTIDHYNSGQLGGGYIVCGYEGGGEYSTFNTGQQPSFSKSLFLSGINDMLLSESAQAPTMPLFGDMNAVGGDYTYTDQEAAIETALSIGMRTNGLELTDLTNIICSQGVSSAYCSAISTPTPCDDPPSSATLGCTSGGWYRNAVTYPTFTGGALAGQRSTLSLQTLNGSQPTNCQVSSTFAIAGPLAPAAASTDCPEGFIGLLNGLVSLRTTGLVNFSGGLLVTVNNAEIYTNGPASCALCSHYDSSAYPVGDILFALDPNYSSTTYAQTSASVLAQVLPYDASFALFLGAQSVYGGCPTSGGGLCETGTWTLGIAPPSPNFYTAYSGTALVPWATVPNFGNLTKNNAVLTDNSYTLPPANFTGQLSPIIRCTDANFEPGFQNNMFSAGCGGSGDCEQTFNANSTALRLNDFDGRVLITSLNKSNLGIGCGTAVNASQNLTTPGSSSSPFNFSGGSWDWSNPNVYYGIPGTQVIPYNFNLSTMDFTVGAPFTDLACGLPMNSCATNAPAWTANTAYVSGQYISAALPGIPDWTASTTYTTSQLGTLIQPTVNNPLNCAFKLTAAGETSASGSEPNWNKGNTGSSCYSASEGAITDNQVKWRNIGGPPTFVFQLTTSNCTSNGSSPDFSSGGFPYLMTVVTEGSPGYCAWTNVGPMSPPSWSSFAGISRNSTRVVDAFSNNQYGWDDNVSTYNGDQGTGIFEIAYDSVANSFELLNTATGWQSKTTCSGGTGYNCSGGTLTLAPQGQNSIFNNNCGIFIHNSKGSGTEDYPAIARQGMAYSPGVNCPTPALGDIYDWVPFAANFSPLTSLQLYDTPSDHWMMLDQTLVNVGGQTVGPPDDYTTGAFSMVLSALTPTLVPLINWQPPCTTTYSVPPPSALPPCFYSLAYDSHMSPAFNPNGTDTGSVCGSIYNNGTLAPPPEAPWQGEEVCLSISPTWVNGTTPNPAQIQYRFAHCFNTGGNIFFDVQFCISQWSGDGQFLAFTSDGNCAFGGTDGSTNPPCGPPWAPSTPYPLNAYINPFSSTGGSGTNYGVFQITTPGTSSTTKPTWSTCSGTVGCVVTDANGVQYTYVGANKSRGDVLIVQLVPVVH